MSILELKQVLWARTPRGEATVRFLIDYGPEADLMWVCIQHDDPHRGEIWTYANSEVRVLDNESLQRKKSSVTLQFYQHLPRDDDAAGT